MREIKCAVPSSCQSVQLDFGVSLLPCLVGHIYSITPTSGTTETNLTITGSNFHSDASCIHVKVGDYKCLIIGVQTNNDTQTITCNIETMPSGIQPMLPVEHHLINIYQGDYGLSLINVTNNDDRYFYLKPVIFKIFPTHGSIGGGTSLTVSGEGFIVNSTELIVDGYGCNIISVNYTSVICITRPRLGSSTGQVEVSFNMMYYICVIST